MKTTNESALDEKDTPPTKMVFVIIAVTFVFLLVAWVLSYAVLSQTTDKIQSASENGMGNKTRIMYIKQQNDYLNSSQQLDNGTYKMPIDQAMDEVIQKANK